MERGARFRINLTTREIEIEGSEAFVREYAERFEELLAMLAKSPVPDTGPAESLQAPADAPLAADLPSTFGEYLNLFPGDITDLDKMLIAGYYVQSQSQDNSFATASAHNLLKEQGIKLANAADCVKKNQRAKRVFAVEKGRFRVSRLGSEHINSLLARR
jgi:hypothetical protein